MNAWKGRQVQGIPTGNPLFRYSEKEIEDILRDMESRRSNTEIARLQRQKSRDVPKEDAQTRFYLALCRYLARKRRSRS